MNFVGDTYSVLCFGSLLLLFSLGFPLSYSADMHRYVSEYLCVFGMSHDCGC